ncbi:hypothetical protein FJZ36_05570 [Candidatus Poribacteria bacterium]|nr:hypothetical protein [Candidatus Poribacteria bacterium]
MNRRLQARSRRLAILLCAAWALGCGSSVVVPMRVRVGSEVDLSRYRRIAVLPFVDQDNRLQADELDELTTMVRRSLTRTTNLPIVPASTTSAALSREELTAETLRDPEYIRSWGGMLESDAIVAGIVRYYSVASPRRQYVERYSYQQQRYVTDIETQIVRTHYVSVELAVWNAESGEVVLPFTRRRQLQQQESVVGYVVREVAGQSSVVGRLIRAPVRDFLRRVAPHYETEERYLAR